jgi:hypothetical protein
MVYNSLKQVKIEILGLNPLTSSCYVLEELLRNALEIMKVNNLSITELSHTYNTKEMFSLINGDINQERIDAFKQVLWWCESQVPEGDFYIDSIPESWSMPLVDRINSSY